MPTLLGHIPQAYERYIEPFLGGGSLFFALRPKSALLADVNEDLINAFVMVREKPHEIQRWLRWLERRHSAELYYNVRSRSQGGDFWKALRFIYLNRTCWNGLYRVNLQGQFNVPMGTKTAVSYVGGLTTQAEALKGVVVKRADFRETLKAAKKGDFVYIDPPYTVRHNNNGFLKYNEKIFSWTDQEALRQEVQRAIERGAKILISNAAHESIVDLYRGLGTLVVVERSSVLAASPDFRRREKEVLIKCY